MYTMSLIQIYKEITAYDSTICSCEPGMHTWILKLPVEAAHATSANKALLKHYCFLLFWLSCTVTWIGMFTWLLGIFYIKQRSEVLCPCTITGHSKVYSKFLLICDLWLRYIRIRSRCYIVISWICIWIDMVICKRNMYLHKYATVFSITHIFIA